MSATTVFVIAVFGPPVLWLGVIALADHVLEARRRRRTDQAAAETLERRSAPEPLLRTGRAR